MAVTVGILHAADSKFETIVFSILILIYTTTTAGASWQGLQSQVSTLIPNHHFKNLRLSLDLPLTNVRRAFLDNPYILAEDEQYTEHQEFKNTRREIANQKIRFVFQLLASIAAIVA